MARWPRRKAAGPDGIVHEAIQALMEDPVWAHRIRYILNDAFYKGTLTDLLEQGVTVLIPKVSAPASWADTRPITISSTLLKWAAQLVLRRTQHMLSPVCRLQWCSRGRQSVEMLLAIRQVMRRARDWGGPFFLIKVDVTKAFDTTSQTSMSHLIEDQIGGQGHPWEARLWAALLYATELNVQVGNAGVFVSQSNGVRQGGPDSPVAFSALVGREVQQTTREVKTSSHGPNPKLPPPPEHTAAYMDDVYVWGESPLHVQHLISRLETNLARHGLKINHKKTCVISNEGAHTFYIAGHQIEAQGPDCPLMVLGSPVAFAGGPALVNAEMSTRARKAFYANKKMFLRTGLKTRLQAHNMVVREAGLWGSPTWPVNDSTLRTANGIQLHHTRDMMQVARKPGESWVEWNTRSLRLARIVLVKYKIPRWSTRILEATWNLWGHVGRAEDPTTRNLATWRGMAWWEQEKAKPDKAPGMPAGSTRT